ncbi:MAG: hypothetical protein H7Y01_13500 [Ferruginibacter sp.]|nr:hypothetical protein [Chitinophagaceae bacterium]
MKKHLLLMLSLAFALCSSAQQTGPATTTQKTGYLKKSKSQKTAAWILLGGGGLLATAGLAVGMNEAVDQLSTLFTGEEQKSSNTGAVLFYTGLASMAGSIPLFIASSKNKKKANSISASFKMETLPSIRENSIVKTGYPAIVVKFSL